MNDWYIFYLNKPWAAVPEPPHSYTCGELMRAVHRDILGIDSADILANPAVLRECVRGMEAPERYGLAELGPGEKPEEFDVLYMGRVKYFDHVGIAVESSEGLLVLHCMQGAGTLLESMSDLRGRGFNVFKWCRHTERPQNA